MKLLAKACRLASPAPCNVGSDEEGAPETSEHTQEDERDEFEKVPRRVVLDVEQHQSAVAEWVYGTQHKCCNQGGEERTPQRLEGEVIAHLEERERTFEKGVVERFYWCSASEFTTGSCTSSKLKRTPPIGAPKATDTPAADAAERT